MKLKVFSLAFEKEQYPKYAFYFDLLKGFMYIILAVIIVEGKLVQISLEQEPRGYNDGYWLSSELGLITVPVVINSNLLCKIESDCLSVFVLIFEDARMGS